MHVIFLAPHFPAGQRRFLRALKQVGARVTGIVDSPIERIDHEVLNLLDAAEVVQSVTSEEQVYQAVRRIQQRGPWVHKLEATIEAHVLCAAAVRERTGIPGTPYEVVDRCRDKVLMKTWLKEKGIPSAAHRGIGTLAEAKAFVEEVGYPVIIKPRAGAGASGTYRIDDAKELTAVAKELGMDKRKVEVAIEEFVVGHEGFYDTITIDGKVVMDFASHYFPNVLPAMRDGSISPMILATNRIDLQSYSELREFGQKVVTGLELGSSATHMEWFFGPKGLRFSEIGARPPGVNFWDVYAAANEFDIYTEWARAMCYGDVHHHPNRRFTGALMAIRPTAQGHVKGYSGMDEVQRRFGPMIIKAHLPAVGSRTQPIEAGYLANAWIMARHYDFDACKAMMEEIGQTLRMYGG